MKKLEDFVSETLQAVVSGVSKAQSALKETGAVVNPVLGGHARPVPQGTYSPMVEEILFDVGVTNGEEVSGGAKAGVFVLTAGIGGRTEGKLTSEQSNRVKFSVRVQFPAGNRPPARSRQAVPQYDVLNGQGI